MRWWRTVLPAPLMSAALFVFWLALNRSLAPAQLVLATIVAFGLPLLVRPLRPVSQRVRRPWTVLRLFFQVGYDVLHSNLQVAACILRPGPPPSGFVVVPLELRDAHGLSALAVISCAVPGAVWCELAPDRSALRLHVMGLRDEAAYIAHFKERYERPLREIFE